MSEPDAWAALRRLTSARIALGRAGVSLPTARALEFQAAHARARTAVHEALDTDALLAALPDAFPAVHILASEAADRATYLRRPDLGRRLDATSRAALSPSEADLSVVICDGLSARAVAQNAAPFLAALLPRLAAEALTLAPLAVVREGRVAIGDEIGKRLGARMVVLLVGERPGLSAADSLGVYITHAPRPGRNDGERNCISNIRPGGLSFDEAAYRAHYLVSEGLARGLTGVALKDDTVAPDAVEGGGSAQFLLPGR
ncbi:MAG: ethanolamine ammonia-lyase subunit EutC [Acuticoccus sp.]